MIPPPEDGSAVTLCSGLLPLCGEGPAILVLGSFPSRLSLAHTRYYGNPKNQFWKIMAVLFGIDPALSYEERERQLIACRIALWDVIGFCRRNGSADAKIRDPAFNDIAGFVQEYPSIRLIVLNGTAAGKYFKAISPAINIPSVILPSTSPANAGITIDEKIRRWSIILPSVTGKEKAGCPVLPLHPEL